ncbi:Fe-S protein assembly chaperone HscA [Proteus sp. G2669]|uniref:Fe-S protein assembly chaperone HscA n=1 Tax=Proteus sp. G2669 TaxID=2698881 RepID=UPI001412A443|nr:Fe-S protein assembly chaperone HscA [Proteus sp. G2669]NBM56004.1 Fe-S protein assembly chaperone HscA [Proteus sp. G2669]
MSLLQISEPGQTPAPHQRRLAAGIDLGTTHSLVATVRSEQAEALSDNEGRYLLPSVVQYQVDNINVGWNAKKDAEKDPANTISSIKRMVGRSLSDVTSRYPNLPYHFHENDNGLPLIKTAAGIVDPIQVSSDILKTLAERATQSLGGELDGVVVTVPAYFDDAQRQGTKEAARRAGLHVLRLLNEPTAAAIAYGLDSGKEGTIVVYDLGGGTFDISVLRLTKGVFEVLATGGDTALGGDDFDMMLADWIRERAGFGHQKDAILQRQLLDVASETKIALSDNDVVDININGWKGEITRAEFESLIQSLVKRTLLSVRRALKDADVDIDEVLEVVMVGGSTRVPLVRQMVGDYFKREPLTSIDPDKVVAIGASIQADILVGNKPDSEMLLLDVIPLSLGLETMGGLVEKVIPRNTTIPVARAQEFTTFKDGQTAMSVHVVQGERELVSDCRSLARFTLRGIPPMAAGGAHIRVTFQVDADGLLSVSAMEKSTGVEASVQVKPSYGLSDTEIAKMIQSSMENAQEDLQARRLAEQKVEAARVLESLTAALEEDAHLLNEDEKTAIDKVVDTLIESVEGTDPVAIENAIKLLDKQTQDFAARRMDSSIRQALAGHSVDEI